ncbi:hypothetical protein OPV22_017239 [Ensete ventricosum]|uniref:Uncharacterized protein n=1 Tax=Ensete ventricosum TaxID=4639 RepID=A0AAV8R1L4_ENSVE|nr:hypothetical protein OPV22_017239 [Ensete ventricosum]
MRDAGGYCLSPASAEAQDSCPKRRWHVIYAHIFLFALSRSSPYVFFISDDCPFRDPRCLLYVQREAGVLRLLLGPSVNPSYLFLGSCLFPPDTLPPGSRSLRSSQDLTVFRSILYRS